MLQHDPSNRLSIRQILTHPWFKLTIVDKVYPNGDVPSIPTSPNATSPTAAAAAAAAGDDFFAESALKQQQQQQQQPRLTPHVAGPSPLRTSNGQNQMARLNSAEFSTTEKELEQLYSAAAAPTSRPACTGTGTGTGTISPRSVSSPSMRGKTLRTLPEGQVDFDQDQDRGDDRLPFIDEHLHLPVALHSRTPSRTKRRSVSSTLSLERRLSHHSAHHSYITFPPEDYLSKLDPSLAPNSTPADAAPGPGDAAPAPGPATFTTPSETRLLRLLDQIGLDVGQLKHSVETDACDASAGLWWLLRQKQQERGQVDVRDKEAKPEKPEKAKPEEAKEKTSTGVMGIRPGKQAADGKTCKGLRFSEEHAPPSGVIPIPAPPPPSLPLPVEPPPSLGTQDGSQPVVITPPLDDNSASKQQANANFYANGPRLKGKSPSMNMLQRATSVLGGVGKKGDDKDKDKNGINDRGDLDSSNSKEEKKASGGGGGGASTGKSNSPNKLKKSIPGAGMKGLAATLSRSESEGDVGGGGGGSVLAGGHSPAVSASGSKTVTPGSSPQRKGLTPQETPRDAKDSSLAGQNTNGMSGGGGGGGGGKGKGGKKDSLWTTFRHLFYEDRRRRNKRQSVTPTSSSASPLVSSEVKLPAGAVVLSRGANSRTSHHKRSNVGYAASTGSRRTSLDGNRPVYSRRSSSIHTNSRRSSVGSLHFQDHQTMISDLSRRASQRSHGSQTPTSDREYLDFSSAAAAAPISRPGSSHSIRGGVGGGSRHSSFSVRSPSLNAETPSASTRFKSSVPPASPLLSYRRRPAGGNDSSRVRHIKVIPESQIMRSSSVASSIRSNPSSRASSMDRDRDRDRESEYESGRDDVSLRSGRRQKKRNGSQRSLAQQIHRTRSPLALSLENTYSSNSVSSMGLGLGGTNRNPKKPLRDVFQKKGKRKDGDDEWVSEDEDEFACGLGQGRGIARRFSNSSGNGTVWMNVDSKANPARSAAAFPIPRMVSQSTSQGGGPRRREHGRKSSLEEERGRPQEGKGKVKGETVAQGLMGMESLSGRNRRNLPDRSTAPGIIEEEEEDEE